MAQTGSHCSEDGEVGQTYSQHCVGVETAEQMGSHRHVRVVEAPQTDSNSAKMRGFCSTNSVIMDVTIITIKILNFI